MFLHSVKESTYIGDCFVRHQFHHILFRKEQAEIGAGFFDKGQVGPDVLSGERHPEIFADAVPFQSHRNQDERRPALLYAVWSDSYQQSIPKAMKRVLTPVSSIVELASRWVVSNRL